MTDEELAREAAAGAFAAGFAGQPAPPGAELRALPLETRERERAGWIVGVVVPGERLAGFVQLDADLGFRRYATFTAPAPPAAAWLDADAVRARAAEHLEPGETVTEAYLGYDRSPDRIAWVVSVAAPDGSERTLLVAGQEVFPPT